LKISVPFSPWSSVRVTFGVTDVVPSMTPNAPLLKRRMATAVSSTGCRAPAARRGRDRFDVARDVEKLVDAVDALIHERAAAVEFHVPRQPALL